MNTKKHRIKTKDAVSKKFPLRLKIIASILATAFIFQSMESINNHTYSIGVDSYHYTCGCFGCWPTHIAVTCKSTICY